MAKVIARVVSLFTKKQDAAAMVEYGLLVGLIALVCIVATQLIGQEISSVFNYLQSTIAAAI